MTPGMRIDTTKHHGLYEAMKRRGWPLCDTTRRWTQCL